MDDGARGPKVHVDFAAKCPWVTSPRHRYATDLGTGTSRLDTGGGLVRRVRPRSSPATRIKRLPIAGFRGLVQARAGVVYGRLSLIPAQDM